MAKSKSTRANGSGFFRSSAIGKSELKAAPLSSKSKSEGGKSDTSKGSATDKYSLRAEKALRNSEVSSMHMGMMEGSVAATLRESSRKCPSRTTSNSSRRSSSAYSYDGGDDQQQQHSLFLSGNGQQVPFVGRDEELASIGEVIDLLVSKGEINTTNTTDVGEGMEAAATAVGESQQQLREDKEQQHPRVINIVGAAGSGKSRLAGELKSLVLDRDGYFVRGKCESSTPPPQQQQQQANAAQEQARPTSPTATNKGNTTNKSLASNLVVNDNDDGDDGTSDSTAYGALANVMKELSDQILARDFDMGIRRRLQEAIKPKDALILTEIFPSLSRILELDDDDDFNEEEVEEQGSHHSKNSASKRHNQQHEQESGSPQDQRARGRRFLFQQFMRVLLLSSIDYFDEDKCAGEEQKPQNEEAFALVLVVDDVQWIDKASLDLLSALVRDQDLENFLLVTTMRPPPPSPPSPQVVGGATPNGDHGGGAGGGEDKRPYGRESKKWQETGIQLKSHHLGSLDSCSINTILSTILDTEGEVTTDLATIIHEKTRGNVFFVLEFIKAIVDQKLLCYSFKDMKWIWDPTDVQSLVINGNGVVGLLIDKLNRLTCNQQLILLVAACLGGSIRLGLLQSVLPNLDGIHFHGQQQQQQEKEEHCDNTTTTNNNNNNNNNTNHSNHRMEETLQTLVRMGLLGHHGDLYYVTHDLLKEAALEFVPPDKIALLKVRIGEHILNNMIQSSSPHPEDSPANNGGGSSLLFQGVRLCNAGSQVSQATTTTTTIETAVLAEYNLLAGEKAMRDSAFSSALRYMERGLWLLGDHDTNEEEKTNNNYNRLLAGAAEASFCAGHSENVNAYADNLLRRSSCSLELRLRMLQIKALSSTGDERFEDAMDYGWSAVKLLHMDTFPQKPSMFHVVKELIKTKRLLKNMTQEQLLVLPVCTDDNRANAQKFFDVMRNPALMVNPAFFIVSQLKEVRWGVKYGINRYTPTAFTLYGTILQNLANDVPGGVMYGDVALELAERLGVRETIAATSMTMFGCLYHTTNDIRGCHAPISYAAKLAMECGDTQNAFTGNWYVDAYSWVGARVPLQVLGRDIERHVAQCLEYKQHSFGDALIVLAIHLRSLCQGNDKSFAWLDFVVDSGYEHRNRPDRKRDDLSVAYRDCIALESHFLLGDPTKALECTKKLHDISKTAMGLAIAPRAHYYRGLVLLAMADDKKSRKQCLRDAKTVIGMMKQWVDNGNVNCLHLLTLLEAEVARIKKQTESAKSLYGDAVRMATRCQQLHDIGLTNQYAGNFFLENGDRSRAAYHMKQAVNGFREWGATTLVGQVQEKHSDLLKETGWVDQQQRVFSIPK